MEGYKLLVIVSSSSGWLGDECEYRAGMLILIEWTNFVGALHGAAAAYLVDVYVVLPALTLYQLTSVYDEADCMAQVYERGYHCYFIRYVLGTTHVEWCIY